MSTHSNAKNTTMYKTGQPLAENATEQHLLYQHGQLTYTS